ncbi:BTB/POZ domain-containing protein 9-like [Zophobas morio]
MLESDETVTITDTTELLGDVTSLYLNQKFSDITLLVDDQKLYAHKVILAVRSKYFESILYEDPQNTNQTEITITDMPFDALRGLLKYIYTDTIDVDSTPQIFEFAHQHSLTDLQTTIVKKLKPLLNLKNICAVLNTANLYNLEELLVACYSFMDVYAPEVVTSDCFTDLSQKSMIQLLQRNSFTAPEIEIFKSVTKWCKINNVVEDLVIQCVRLSWMTAEDIVTTVWPSKLFDCEKLLQAIAEIVGAKTKTSPSRGFYLVGENLATAEHNAEVILGKNTSWLLTGDGNIRSKYAYHGIDGKSGIIVKLGTPCFVNHFKMRLWDGDTRSYSYYISVSLDQKNWRRVIDYSRIRCGSDQVLFFIQQMAQYIKIVGTQNTANEKSMIQLLQRNSFIVPEIEIFKSVAKWCKINNDVDDLVIQCVRLSSMTVVDIVTTVWPSKLFDCEKLLQAIAEIDETSTSRGFYLLGENIATAEHNAEVILGKNTSWLLTGDGNIGMKYAYHTIDGKSEIIVKLGTPCFVNHFKMRLWDGDNRSYSYYISVSLDQTYWRTVIDYSCICCGSDQVLFFSQQMAQYIKIVGTQNTANQDFHIISFEAYFKSDIPTMRNDIICPNYNVATVDKKAIVIEGEGECLSDLFDGSLDRTNCYHKIDHGHITIQLAQPYMISTMRFLLDDCSDARHYNYLVETSINYSDWEIAVDRRNENCSLWQNLHFEERAVVFIRITGTYDSLLDDFLMSHFECPSEMKNT